MENEEANMQSPIIQNANAESKRKKAKKRFTKDQINSILNEVAAGAKMTHVCKKYGITTTTFYQWKNEFRGKAMVEPNAKQSEALKEKSAKFEEKLSSEVKRVKILEEENAQLKIMLAEALLDNRRLKENFK